MIKTLKARNLTKTTLGAKCGIIDLRKRSFENKNYSLTYTIKGRSLVIDFLKVNTESNLGQLKKIYQEVLDVAKDKKLKTIYTKSWVFSETKGLSERLGFKLVKGSDKKFNLIKEKYPDYKITGLEQRFFTDPRSYGLHVCLIFTNKSLKKEVVIPIEKETLPIYVKEI